MNEIGHLADINAAFFKTLKNTRIQILWGCGAFRMKKSPRAVIKPDQIGEGPTNIHCYTD